MVATIGSRDLFNRQDNDNTFRDFSFVFVPYYTGDIHAGANPDGLGGRNQVGYRNVTVYLGELTELFAGTPQVVLTGSSAAPTQRAGCAAGFASTSKHV